MGLADNLIIGAVCLLFAIIILEYVAFLTGMPSSHEVSLGIAAVCVLILFIFRRRIKRKIYEATH